MTLTNALESRLGYQLRRASAVMMADLSRELADMDLRPAEVTTLLVIAENPDCSQTEVGQALAIKRANMVPIISRLMERGLVARRPFPLPSPAGGGAGAGWSGLAGWTPAR